MSLRDRLTPPEKCGPTLKVDLLLHSLEPETAEELRELLADPTVNGVQLTNLINQLCDEHNIGHAKMRLSTLNRYRRENL
jgi:F0F1-type ATP synthase delta subunit